MTKNRADTGTITGIAEATAERVMLSGEILKAMAESRARRDKTRQRFAMVVLMKLARIEATVEKGELVFACTHAGRMLPDEQEGCQTASFA